MTAPARAFRASASRRPLLTVLIAILCIDLLTALVVLAYGNAYLLRTLGASASAPAFALTTFGVVKLVSAPLGGRLVDIARPRTVLGLIVAIELVALALILITRSAHGYFAGVGLLAAGIAISWITVFRVLGVASAAEERGTLASSISIVSAVATGAGFGLAALIAETGPWWLPFALGVPLGLAGVVLLRRPARPTGSARAAMPVAASPVPLAPRAAHPPAPLLAAPDEGEPHRTAARVAAAGVVFGHFSIVTGLLVVFWPFTLAMLGLSPLRAMALLLPAGAIGLAALVLSGRWSRPGRRLPQAAALYAVAASGLVAMAIATNAPWFAIAAVLVAPALAGAQPVLLASMIDISRSTGRRAGTALGWLFSAEALGAIAGPAVVGVAIELWDVRAGVLVIAAGAATLAALAAVTSRVVRL